MTSTLEIRGTGDAARAFRTWGAPEDPKADLLIVHGLAEHSGRFEHVGDFLTAAGYRVTGIDLPGCGRSGGRRANVEDMDIFLDAVEEGLESARSELPLVLYGHSMGGLVSLTYALSDRPAPDLLVLSSPWLGNSGKDLERKAASLAAKLLPKMEIPNPLEGEALCRDAGVVQAYFDDPLVYTKTTLGQFAMVFEAQAVALADAGRLDIPTYLFLGTDDEAASPQYSVPLGEQDGVTRRLWPGLRHELHNEPEQGEVLGEVVEWLDANT